MESWGLWKTMVLAGWLLQKALCWTGALPALEGTVNYGMQGCWRNLQVKNFPALGSPGKTQLSLPIYCPIFLKQQGPLP